MMEMTHRQVILDLIAKRFENVLGDDARDVLQILMELYCDAKALDQIAVENRPTVPAAPPAQHKPKKSKSGGRTPTSLPMRSFPHPKSRARRMQLHRKISGAFIR